MMRRILVLAALFGVALGGPAKHGRMRLEVVQRLPLGPRQGRLQSPGFAARCGQGDDAVPGIQL
mgnify:CR=1 FL=1